MKSRLAWLTAITLAFVSVHAHAQTYPAKHRVYVPIHPMKIAPPATVIACSPDEASLPECFHVIFPEAA